MLVSYLIATWNRKAVLKRHLDMLLEQTWPHWFEVIVCVDGSTDGTQEMLACMANTWKYTLQWADTGSVDKFTAAKSRNNGIRMAQGELVIMADDDCLPHRELIASYAREHQPERVQVGYKSSIEAYLDMVLPVPIEPGTMTIHWNDWQQGAYGHFQSGSCAMSLAAARTPAKDGSLGFDERFVGYGHEDSEFGQRLYRAGDKTFFNRDAEIWHVNDGSSPQQDPVRKAMER